VSADPPWRRIARAWREQTWRTLGYPSWAEFCAVEHPAAGLPRLTPAQRRPIVRSMRARGMPIRAIAVALGVAAGTVSRDLTRVQSGTSETSETAQGGTRDPHRLDLGPLGPDPVFGDDPLADVVDPDDDDPDVGLGRRDLHTLLAAVRRCRQGLARGGLDSTIDLDDARRWRSTVARELGALEDELTVALRRRERKLQHRRA